MQYDDTQPNTVRPQGLQVATSVCALVFAASMLGIMTRPAAGQLAALWPANAILLGVMVRFPALATRWGWLGALAGYLLPSALDDNLVKTLLLTAGNLAAVGTGYLLLMRLSEEHRRLRLPLSVPYLVVVATAAATAGGLVGAIADPLLFGGTPLSGLRFWFVSELVNFMALLPLLLTLPDLERLRRERRHAEPIEIARLLPLLSFVLMCVLGQMVGGPGAVAFPVPALLWCALSYSFFSTCVLTLVFTCWTLVAVSMGYLSIDVVDMNSRPMQLSLRLGVMLLALGPITVASVMAARNEVLRRLQHLAHHDPLSGLLNRRAFHEQAGALLQQLAAERRPAAMLMLDIDQFKSINDRHGHAAGDRVLTAFARLAATCLRDHDPFGRIGGEEFAVLLADCPPARAAAIAQRLCDSFAATPTLLDDGRPLSATVSIGVAHAPVAGPDIDALLLLADRALYRAKAAGRNRIEALDGAAAAPVKGAPAPGVAPDSGA